VVDSRGVRTTARGGEDPVFRECGVADRGAIRSMAFAGVAAETAADPALAESGGDGLSLCPAWGGANLLLPVSLGGLTLPVSLVGPAFTEGEGIKFAEPESGLLQARLVPTVDSEGEDARCGLGGVYQLAAGCRTVLATRPVRSSISRWRDIARLLATSGCILCIVCPRTVTLRGGAVAQGRCAMAAVIGDDKVSQ